MKDVYIAIGRNAMVPPTEALLLLASKTNAVVGHSCE
jgi:hypothetical protein